MLSNVHVSVPMKSMGISILLTLLFGPLGLFYSSIVGGIVMIIVSAIVGFITFGFGLIFTQLICIVWGAFAVDRYNKDLLAKYN